MRGIEEGHVPLSKHYECDIEVGGQIVHHVGMLVKKDKIPLVDSKGRKAKTPALLGRQHHQNSGQRVLRNFWRGLPSII